MFISNVSTLGQQHLGRILVMVRGVH